MARSDGYNTKTRQLILDYLINNRQLSASGECFQHSGASGSTGRKPQPHHGVPLSGQAGRGAAHHEIRSRQGREGRVPIPTRAATAGSICTSNAQCGTHLSSGPPLHGRGARPSDGRARLYPAVRGQRFAGARNTTKLKRNSPDSTIKPDEAFAVLTGQKSRDTMQARKRPKSKVSMSSFREVQLEPRRGRSPNEHRELPLNLFVAVSRRVRRSLSRQFNGERTKADWHGFYAGNLGGPLDTARAFTSNGMNELPHFFIEKRGVRNMCCVKGYTGHDLSAAN